MNENGKSSRFGWSGHMIRQKGCCLRSEAFGYLGNWPSSRCPASPCVTRKSFSFFPHGLIWSLYPSYYRVHWSSSSFFFPISPLPYLIGAIRYLFQDDVPLTTSIGSDSSGAWIFIDGLKRELRQTARDIDSGQAPYILSVRSSTLYVRLPGKERHSRVLCERTERGSRAYCSAKRM